jgi:hypothetical protein
LVGNAMKFSRKVVGILVITLMSAVLFSPFMTSSATADGGWNGGTTVPVQDNITDALPNTNITLPEISTEQYFIAGGVLVMFFVMAISVSVIRRH